MANYYCSSADYMAVAQWAATHAYSVGNIVRQLAAPAAGSERCFRCTTAGTSLASEPTWTLTKSATTTESGGPVWTECTGQAAYNGDGGGSAWGAPFYSLLGATASGWMAAGDTLFLRNTHSVAYGAAATLPFGAGAVASPCKLLCTNATSMPPASGTLTTGALEYTNGAFTLQLGGAGVYWLMQGVTFTAGAGAVTANLLLPGYASSSAPQLVNCTLGLGGTTGGILAGNTSIFSPPVRLTNCNLNFTAANQSIATYGFQVEWNGGAITGTAPTTLFSPSTSRGFNGHIKNVDLSLVTGTLFAVTNFQLGRLEFWNCKLGSGVTMPGATNLGINWPAIAFYNCDSGATNYRYFLSVYPGTVQHSTTYARTGGASDGTTALSWQITSNGNCSPVNTLTTDDIVEWNSLTSGTHTATVYLYSNAVLTNANCWLELDYPSSASSPLGASVTSFAGQLVTGTGLTVDSSTWSGSALTYKYAISVSFNPAAAGPLRARLYLGVASSTVYLDPLVTVA